MDKFNTRALDLPCKAGFESISSPDWQQIADFIASEVWNFADPVLAADAVDPLLAKRPAFGAFMLGFDFHLTKSGPRLIEINTNAGGFASLMYLAEQTGERQKYEEAFVSALRTEYARANLPRPLLRVLIVDDDLKNQKMYPEMFFLASLLTKHGILTEVCEASELQATSTELVYQGHPIDLVYNRLIDFRLTAPQHAALRTVAISGACVVTPHPSIYVRIADKRNLMRLKHPMVPECLQFSDRPLEFWLAHRKKWVFKQSTGASARGVYRGDKITAGKLQSLPPDTIAQLIAEPSRSSDGSKQDIRVYTCGNKILGCVARQYEGQVMEMQSEKAGFRLVHLNKN